jgi:hydrogenase maturation protease
VLIVGYGNTLRGDDAAGFLVAETIEALGLDGVEVLVCHQLTPEISERAATAERVIFIDAGEANEHPVEVGEIVEGTGAPVFGHGIDPRAILALARRLFGRAPRAWLVSIAAHSFELGAGPSPDCAAGMALAVEAVKGLCAAKDEA